jgi:hypothetical protein
MLVILRINRDFMRYMKTNFSHLLSRDAKSTPGPPASAAASLHIPSLVESDADRLASEGTPGANASLSLLIAQQESLRHQISMLMNPIEVVRAQL